MLGLGKLTSTQLGLFPVRNWSSAGLSEKNSYQEFSANGVFGWCVQSKMLGNKNSVSNSPVAIIAVMDNYVRF